VDKLRFRSVASKSLGYRADIDGLRAIAVLAVLFFHAHVTGFDGGFVGVDIFFVISGYLITGVIEKDLSAGRFTFAGFYERRIRRIFPALFTVLLACAAAGIVLFPPRQLQDFGRSLLAVSGFASNFYFKSTSRQAGYFADSNGTQYLLHTWSLAVEEQFYFLFPILLLLLYKIAPRYKRHVLGVLAIVSLVVCFRAVERDPVWAFYLLPARAWELLLGSLLALQVLRPMRAAAARAALGALGLACMAYGIRYASPGFAFTVPAGLIPCVGAGLVLYAGEGGASIITRGMSLPPFVFIGAISYSLYLWHWPLLALAKFNRPFYNFPPSLAVAPLIVAFVLAFLSFEFIETPFRTRRQHGTQTRRAVWIGVAASAALAGLSLILVLSHGLPHRYRPATMTILSTNYARKSENASMGDCANYRMDLPRYQDAHFCGTAGGPENVLLWGDSHAQQLYPLLKTMQESGALGGRGVVTALSGGCPTAETLNRREPGFHCDRFGAYALRRASQQDIDTVLIAFSPWWALPGMSSVCPVRDGVCVPMGPGQQVWSLYLADLEETIRGLMGQGKHVIVTVPFPLYDSLIPDVEIRNSAMRHLHFAAMIPKETVPEYFKSDTRALAARTGATLFDPNDVLCRGARCIYAIDNLSLYVDESHLAQSRLGILEPDLLQALHARPVVPANAGARKAR
jgi:peptidoglycan/LPS O-acetylase OafA/YrhL